MSFTATAMGPKIVAFAQSRSTHGRTGVSNRCGLVAVEMAESQRTLAYAKTIASGVGNGERLVSIARSPESENSLQAELAQLR